MRLIRCNTPDLLAALTPGAVLCHDVRDPASPRTVAIRKGRRLDAADLARLIALAPAEIHVLIPEAGDLLEDEAAPRIAAAVAGPGLTLSPSHNGQVTLMAERRGWLKIDPCAVERVNLIEGALLFTSFGDRAADVGETVGGVKCAPLLLSPAAIEAVERACAEHGPAVRIEAFPARKVALVGLDRLGDATLARAQAALGATVAWLGSALDPVLIVPADDTSPAKAFRQAVAAGASAILVAGASATDPLDAAFEGLRQAGGTVDQIGLPIEPGTACWTGRLGEVQVLGLASCELFGRQGAVDVLLPRLLLGEPLTRPLLARLGAGGLVDALPVHRALV